MNALAHPSRARDLGPQIDRAVRVDAFAPRERQPLQHVLAQAERLVAQIDVSGATHADAGEPGEKLDTQDQRLPDSGFERSTEQLARNGLHGFDMQAIGPSVAAELVEHPMAGPT